ncbi:RHS repeat protein [Candidatus Sodalis endolongispinus]|uniref:RHS repeat protein n=1 Tax=Candidatus Sodalis endolongispinus TaxID=2812662 RepID=A0ABS5YCC9_9GAMM|nr:hypothetical protein [Candidatus Sodalis endolongispinus]MBT9432603.1 RHS repeat protein [Candidatus Sodalis endolongispinus]
MKTLDISYYNEPEATFGSRHGRLKSQCITYTTEQEKTVVSKDYLWEKRTVRDKISAGYELVCTCHFNAGETLAKTHPATDAGAQQQRPKRTPPDETFDAAGSTSAQSDGDAQQRLTTTTCWSLPDYHPTTCIDAQGNRTDYRYQNNGLYFSVTRYAKMPCAAEQHRAIRYNLQQNTLGHITETDCLGNTVHRYHDGFGRLHNKTYTHAPLAGNPVTLEERRYDGAGRLTSIALNDWQMTAPAPTQITRNLCDYYYDEWGQVGVILHHDGEQGQYHLIQNDIPNHSQTREQFPYDVASRSVDLRSCASGVVEEHYDLFGRPAKLLREARSALTLAGLQSYFESPERPDEATQSPDSLQPTGEQACEFNYIGKLISAVELHRDDMQRIVKITETLSNQYVNYHYGYHDRLSLVNIGGTGDIRYSYDHHDGPPTRVRFIPPFRTQQPSSKPAIDQYVLYECSLDRWGRILSENHGGQRANVWRYQGAHPRPAGYTDACHHSVQYRYYDHFKHALVEIKHDTSLRRFTYDGVGRLISIQDHFLPDTPGPCLRYEYNSAGQLARETVYGPRDEEGFWTEYDYSLSGRVLQSRDSLGQTRLYSYNRAGRLRALTASEAELHVGYDALGRLAHYTVTERSTGKGLRRELRYGFFNRVTQIAITPCGPQMPNARAILISLQYNESDRITGRTITETVANMSRSRHEAFDYDHRGCLTDCRFKGDLPLLVSDGQTDRQVLCLTFKRDDIANITQVITRTQPVGAAAANAADETEFTVNYLYQDSEVPTRLRRHHASRRTDDVKHHPL